VRGVGVVGFAVPLGRLRPSFPGPETEVAVADALSEDGHTVTVRTDDGAIVRPCALDATEITADSALASDAGVGDSPVPFGEPAVGPRVLAVAKRVHAPPEEIPVIDGKDRRKDQTSTARPRIHRVRF
jgi:hypothetical protein